MIKTSGKNKTLTNNNLTIGIFIVITQTHQSAQSVFDYTGLNYARQKEK